MLEKSDVEQGALTDLTIDHADADKAKHVCDKETAEERSRCAQEGKITGWCSFFFFFLNCWSLGSWVPSW